MNNSSNNFINKLPIDGDGESVDQYVIVKTNWLEDRALFKLLKCTINEGTITFCSNDGYSGILNFNEISKTAFNLEIDFDEFLNEIKNAFINENGNRDFIYQFINDNNTFVWRKVKDSGFKITYGSIDLIKCKDLKNEMLNQSLNIMLDLRKECETERSTLAEFKKIHEDFKNLLERCISEKNNIENELICKCTSLLNTKKQRIQQLEDMLKHNKSADTSFNCSSNNYDYDDDNGLINDKNDGTTNKMEQNNLSQSSDSAAPALLPKRVKASNKIVANPQQNVTSTEIPKNRELTPDVYECNTEELYENM